MIRLVVARYNEDLSWLAGVPAGWQVFVYNKGDECPAPAPQAKRPNIGREAETFCHHNATVTPAGWTAFVQGNPFDHWPDPIGHIQRIVERGDRVGWLGFHYDTAWNVPPHTVASLDVPTTWHDLGLPGPCPRRLSFPAGAQMVVHDGVIGSRDRAWWQRAKEVATTEDWRVAHAFERLWPVVYS